LLRDGRSSCALLKDVLEVEKATISSFSSFLVILFTCCSNISDPVHYSNALFKQVAQMLMIGRLGMLEHRMTKVAIERSAHGLNESEVHFELTETLELKAEA
jgi:hypothetical protein